jgi:hypothetical protein
MLIALAMPDVRYRTVPPGLAAQDQDPHRADHQHAAPACETVLTNRHAVATICPNEAPDLASDASLAAIIWTQSRGGMNPESPPAGDAGEEIAGLIQTLHRTGVRLEDLPMRRVISHFHSSCGRTFSAVALHWANVTQSRNLCDPKRRHRLQRRLPGTCRARAAPNAHMPPLDARSDVKPSPQPGCRLSLRSRAARTR